MNQQNRLEEIDEILMHLSKEQKKLDKNSYKTIIYNSQNLK